VSTEAAARAWAEALAPVTDAMLDLARPMPGEHVLDVGASAGQLALEIAARVGPSGQVLAIDPSPETIADIERAARDSRNRAPLRALVASAESLDVGAARFDLAVARNSVMYFEDLPRALANLRRALRPGGRLVASVYAPLDDEPFHAIPLAAVSRRCVLERPLPEYAAAFEVGARDVESALLASGWSAVTGREVAVRRSFPAPESLRTALRGSRSLAELLGRLPAAQHAEAWQEIDAGFDAFATAAGVVVPGRQVLLAATA